MHNGTQPLAEYVDQASYDRGYETARSELDRRFVRSRLALMRSVERDQRPDPLVDAIGIIRAMKSER